MAYEKMIPASADNPCFPHGHYKASETLSSPGTGDWILVESGIKQINIDYIITAGEGYIEATNDYDGVIAGTAVGFKWSAGNVTANTQETAVGVAAIRQVNVSGTTKVIVNGVL